MVPTLRCASDIVIYNNYSTEGDFKSPIEFIVWLERNKLTLLEFGYMHKVAHVSADANGLIYLLQMTLEEL